MISDFFLIVADPSIKTIFIISVSVALFGCILLIISRLILCNPGSKYRTYILPILSSAIVGVAAGYIGGMSRVGVAGEIVAAAIALIGGVALYFFGAERQKQIVAIITIVFVVGLSIGFLAGASDRIPMDSLKAIEQSCLKLYMDPQTTDARLELLSDGHKKLCTDAINRLVDIIYE